MTDSYGCAGVTGLCLDQISCVASMGFFLTATNSSGPTLKRTNKGVGGEGGYVRY